MAGIVRNNIWYGGVQTPATVQALGLVKPDGISTSVTAQGVISGKDFGYVECSTGRNVAAKTVALTGFALQTGAKIHIRFTDTGSSDPASGNISINVNSTGAKTVVNGRSNLDVITYADGGQFCNNIVNEFVYDGTYWVWTNADSNTTYTPQALGFGYGTCSTAASTAAKTATLSGYNLVANGFVAIKFTNAVPADATLSINSQAAKNIVFRGSQITAGIIGAGDTATFVYDGTQYQLLSVDSAITASARSLMVESANP